MADKNGILCMLSGSEKTMFGKEEFAAQSNPQRVFSSIWALEAEVNNGGFSQFFLNDSSETAGFVVEALETIGAPKTADICRRAIKAAFPGGFQVILEPSVSLQKSSRTILRTNSANLMMSSFNIRTISRTFCSSLSQDTLKSLANCRSQTMHRAWVEVSVLGPQN